MLTDRRLIFDPLRIDRAMSPLVAPYVRDAIKAAMRPLPLSQIAAVRADERSPAVIRVDAERGALRYLVLTSRDTRPRSRGNAVARNDAVRAISGGTDEERNRS